MPLQAVQGVQGQPHIVKEAITNVFTKFSYATKGGIAANNTFKQNQDVFITAPHVMGIQHCHFFAVCDGHGINGHHVSNLLKFTFPKMLDETLSPTLKTTTEYPEFRSIK